MGYEPTIPCSLDLSAVAYPVCGSWKNRKPRPMALSGRGTVESAGTVVVILALPGRGGEWEREW